MMGYGNMTINTEKEQKNGMITHITKEAIIEEKSTAMEAIHGPIIQNTKVIGSIIELKAKVSTVGMMEENLKVIG